MAKKQNGDMKLDVLAFSAHPDDIELAAAGTLIKLVSQGYKVGIVDMTNGEFGTRGTPAARRKEAQEAARIIGASAREFLGIPDGHVTVSRENHHKVMRMLRKYKPNIVMTHYWRARHPDHVATSQLVTEACYLSGLAKMDTGQERHRPRRILYHQVLYDVIPSFLVDVSDFIEQRRKAIAAHKSQFYDPKSKAPETRLSHPSFLDDVESKLRFMGQLIGVRFAESFLTTDPVVIPDLVEAMG